MQKSGKILKLSQLTMRQFFYGVDAVMLAAAEQKQGRLKWIQPEFLLYQRC